MKLSNILGLNARAQLYSYHYNAARGKRIADSKLQTARILKEAGIAHPKIYKKFRTAADVFEFDWNSLPDSFALKPSRGLGGEGIIVVKKRRTDKTVKGTEWITTQKTKVNIDDLKLHTLDILEGAFSLGNVPDVAFIQEYVGRHKAFRKYAFRGTPDIRIIVFNKVPVMAMLRLPTEESNGRANLFQGAIGVGIDIATGITTKAILHDEQITHKVGTNIKLRGIKIPNWTEILKMAVRAQMISGLGYLGADIVLDPEKGPMVLELNAQPGLKIQLANTAGLKKRLERVEDLDVSDAEHGVRIAKALFAERFADRVKAQEGIRTIKAIEEIKILNADGRKVKVTAKIDTGAWSSAIDKKFVKELGLLKKNRILWHRRKVSSLGEEQRPVIPITFWLAGRKIKTRVSVSNRTDLSYKFLVGRTDLTGFLVNPEIEEEKLVASSKW
jgi:alpha-L-glutamate ligase-like protein